MAGLTLDPTVAASAAGTDSYVSQLLGQAVRQRRFSAAAAAGDATTVLAAVTGSRHLVHAIYVDVDTAGKTLAILSASTVLLNIRFPVADTYLLTFRYPIECTAAALLALDKGTVAAIAGIIWYSTITSGMPSVAP